MANFETIFNSEKPEKKTPGQKTIKPMNIHYSKLLRSHYQYREFEEESVQKLAELILADGEILQPLLVRKAGPDSYEIIAGHKRAAAITYIVEKLGLSAYAMIPCYVNNMDDVKAEFAVYSTNGYEDKTPYEQMREIEGMIRLLKEHPEKFRELGKGRLVERLSKVLNISRKII